MQTVQWTNGWLALGAAVLWLVGLGWLGLTWLQQAFFRRQLSLAPLPARPRWRALALLTAASSLVLSLAQPVQWQNSAGPSGEAADLVVALDLSRSMMSEDVAPSRLGRAKELLYDLLANPPRQLRLGLVVFAGEAYVQMPLSPDLVTAQMQVQAALPANMPVQGTALAAALQRGAALLDNKEIRQKNLWLLTDGENHEPGMAEALTALKQLGTVVTTVGFGSAEGAPIRNPFTGNPQQDADGNPILTKPNVALLQEIAAGSNGRYVDGNDLNAAAQQLRQQLSTAQGRAGAGLQQAQTSLAHWPLALALALLMVWLLTGDQRRLAVAALWLFPLAGFAQSKQPITYEKAFALLQQAHAAFARADYPAADLLYQQAAAHTSFKTVVQYNRAMIAYQQGQFPQAAEGFGSLAGHRQLLVSHRAANNQGLALGRQQQWQQAVEAFKQALRADPTDVQARENLQFALHQLKKQQPPPPPKQDNKQQKQPPPKQMDKQRAEDLLNQLRQQENQLRKQLQQARQRGQNGQAKDW